MEEFSKIISHYLSSYQAEHPRQPCSSNSRASMLAIFGNTVLIYRAPNVENLSDKLELFDPISLHETLAALHPQSVRSAHKPILVRFVSILCKTDPNYRLGTCRFARLSALQSTACCGNRTLQFLLTVHVRVARDSHDAKRLFHKLCRADTRFSVTHELILHIISKSDTPNKASSLFGPISFLCGALALLEY